MRVVKKPGKNPVFWKILAVFLSAAVLLAGCAERTDKENPGKAEGSSSSSGVEVDEAVASRLLEEFILPYEALAGGAAFASPEEIQPDVMAAFCFYAAQAQLGEERFLAGDENHQYMLLPEEWLDGYAQILFGASAPADLGDTELVYCDSEFSDEGKTILPEELRGYTGRVYGSSYVKKGMVPDYQVSLQEVKDTGSGVEIQVGRRVDSIDLPDVTYSFVFVPAVENPLLGEQFPAGAYRLTEVQADIGPEFTQISTPQQLVQLSKMVNCGDKTYVGSTFVLTEDLDMSGVKMEPIGVVRRFSYKGVNPFAATFDGQGHTISHLAMDHPFQPADSNGISLPVGLFGRTAQTAVIQNLHLKDLSIRGDSGVGGLAGSFSGRMYHCTVSGEVSGKSDVGGMVGGTMVGGTGNAELVDCHVDVQVTGTGGTGGFAGYAGHAWFEGCSAKGTVSIGADEPGSVSGVAGGFAGHQQGSVIRNCFASVNVRTMTNASMVGNFIGLSEYATTIHSYCNADAGSAWDLVDDDYGGYIDVTALPKAEYWKKLEESIPEGYTKDNGIFGTNYNSKVALVGVVDFDKDTLAALIYYPDERTNNYVQDCDSLDVSEGKMLLIPIHKDFQVAVYADFPEGRQEIYRASAEDKLAWRTKGYALRLDCDYLLLEEKVPIILQLEQDGRTVEYVPDPSQAGGQMQVVYLDATEEGPGF